MIRPYPVANPGQSVHERTNAARRVSHRPLAPVPPHMAEHQFSWFVAPSGEWWRVRYYRTECRHSGRVAVPLVAWWIATRAWDFKRSFLFPAPVGIDHTGHDLWALFDQAWRAHVFGSVHPEQRSAQETTA